MHKLIKYIAAISLGILLAACSDGLTEREKSCLELTGGSESCLRELRNHEVDLAEANNGGRYIQQGYGGGQYGDDYEGQAHFSDGVGESGFLSADTLLAGMGGYLLGGYVAKRGANGKYMIKDKKGNLITPNEYSRRVAQSKDQKAKNAMKKADEKRIRDTPALKSNLEKRKAEREKLKAANGGKMPNRLGKLSEKEKKIADKKATTLPVAPSKPEKPKQCRETSKVNKDCTKKPKKKQCRETSKVNKDCTRKPKKKKKPRKKK